MILLDLVLLVVGLAVLVWAADQFVLGSSRLAAIFSLSPVIIGAVVMGFGTSAPELIVSTIAAAGGDRDLGVGNIVGSNVANLSLVLGTAAFVTRMPIPREVLRREGPLAIAASVMFTLFVVGGSIERWEGVVLVVSLVVVIGYLVRSGQVDDLDELIGADEHEEMSTGREAGRTLLGLVGTVVGAQLVVAGATDIASTLGVTGGFIGFSLVALGTSLPELVTTVACARRGETELIVGNLFGSNIFNVLAVGGVMGLVGPGAIGDGSLTGLGVVAMLVVAVVSYGLASRGAVADRRDGAVMLAMYVVAMIVLATNTGSDAEEFDGVRPAVDASAAPAPIDDGAGFEVTSGEPDRPVVGV